MTRIDLRVSLLRRYSSFVGVYWSQNTPVIVYQMGKVGSSSIRNSLLRCGVQPVLHLHSFLPLRDEDAETAPIDDDLRAGFAQEIAEAESAYENAHWRERLNVRYREWAHNKRIYDRYVRDDRPAKFVTLVRDPISTNISMFFQLFADFLGTPYEPGRFSTEELLEVFRDRYPHSRPLTWLDAELKARLGIDVFASSFPQAAGYATYRQGNFELLLIKCELENEGKQRALCEFLQLDDFRIVSSNVASDKNYAQQYREFKQLARFTEPFLDRMYDSKYARQFYDEAERSAFRARWRQSD